MVDIEAIKAQIGMDSAPGTGGTPDIGANLQAGINPEGIATKVEEVVSTEPPFEVIEITTSARISPTGTYSSFERAMTLKVNTKDKDLVAKAKNLAMNQVVHEAITGANLLIEEGRKAGTLSQPHQK